MGAMVRRRLPLFFFFNDTATTEIYTLSLHDALPIWLRRHCGARGVRRAPALTRAPRSEEHTSELQSRLHLVCRLLLEKKNTIPARIFAAPHQIHQHGRSLLTTLH